jgi:endonuclease-3 related protein
MSGTLQNAFDILYSALGPQHWWPGESPFEVMVGAILVQNTSWRNVSRAIDAIKEDGLLEPDRLYALPEEELAELLRPVGYYRIKARRLRNLLRLVVEDFDGSVERLLSLETQTLRETLLAVNGVGPETADSIVLYAAEKPSFVVDAYTHRIFARHGWIDYSAGYYEIKDYCESELPQDVQAYNELHALLVHVGHHWCKKVPRCDACPLRELLPEGGVVEPT